MPEFRTKIKYKETIIVLLIIFLVILIFFPFETLTTIEFWIIFLLFLIIYFTTSKQLTVNNQNIIIRNPLNPFKKPLLISWTDLEKVNVTYRETLIDLGKTNTITFELKGGKTIENKITINKKEFFILKELSESYSINFERKGIIPAK